MRVAYLSSLVLFCAVPWVAGCGAADDQDLESDEEVDALEEAINGCPQGGVRVWEHGDFQGRSATFCEGWYPYLGNIRTNLNAWESWNDRISSYMTFGLAATDAFCPYRHSNYSYRRVGVLGNAWVDYVGNFDNDSFSSLKIGPSSQCN